MKLVAGVFDVAKPHFNTDERNAFAVPGDRRWTGRRARSTSRHERCAKMPNIARASPIGFSVDLAVANIGRRYASCDNMVGIGFCKAAAIWCLHVTTRDGPNAVPTAAARDV
ncbi:hypothetical protein [uncultured Sphingomonas sp.]|uniref:hypothetical protein n=1 Tax=uncultured Sphingomonas sp. TaxID=158754 RepID=UPI0025E59A4F|nr:hypothetical protein [uncultured Sphingomonas sp.]